MSKWPLRQCDGGCVHSPTCEAGYAEREAAEQTRKAYEAEYRMVCGLCGQRFMEVAELFEHVNAHDEEPEDGPGCWCGYCDRDPECNQEPE